MEVLLEMAIDLACQIQGDDRYLALRAAQEEADKDEELQTLIGEFNMKRIAINTEETRQDGEKDVEKLRALNVELQEIYGKIMANDHMIQYNAARTELDGLVSKIHAAISLAAQGQDPRMAAEEGSCSGNCSSCGGCGG